MTKSALLSSFLSNPKLFLRQVVRISAILQAQALAENWPMRTSLRQAAAQPNPLIDYFENHKTGPGIWKWRHYFEVYHRHFQKFRGREVYIAEVGIYSGGSLGMWREYFGNKCKVYGIDIAPECRAYENEYTRIFIGDQADRAFWKEFRREVPKLDILIDDGGHESHQQIVTLEETLPYMRPGGVFVCEDNHGSLNDFSSYTGTLMAQLNAHTGKLEGSTIINEPNNFQRSIESIHQYPYITVIQKREAALNRFECEKHGSQWEPFYKPL